MSCDVIFNEQKFGHDDIGQETESQKYVYFDCFDDISDSDCHTVEESPANSTEESLQITKKKFLPIMRHRVLSTPRCSQREKRSLIDGFSCNLATIEEQVSMKDALMQKEWIDAMNSEIDSLHNNYVWHLIELSKYQRVVRSKWYSK